MAIAPTIIFFEQNNKCIPGPIAIDDPESDLTGCYVDEFSSHTYTISKDYFYTLLYGTDFVRQHKPIVIIKPINKMSVPLVDYFRKGKFFSKVEIRWPRYDKLKNKFEEYFRITLEHIRISSIKHIMYDVKNNKYDRYNHLEEVQLVFQKITWLYIKGHISYTDIWNNAFDEFEQKDFSLAQEEPTEILLEKLSFQFASGEFETLQEIAFDKKVIVNFRFNCNRKLNRMENKVFAKLYAIYNGRTEDLRQITEGRLVNQNNWKTQFILKKPSNYKDGKVEYFAVIENPYASNNNFKSNSISLPEIKGYVYIFCSFVNIDISLETTSCILKNSKGKTFLNNFDPENKILWDKVVLDSYSIEFKFDNITYIAFVPWQKTNKTPYNIILKKI